MLLENTPNPTIAAANPSVLRGCPRTRRLLTFPQPPSSTTRRRSSSRRLRGRLRRGARAARRRFRLHALALDDLVLRLGLLERAERQLLLLFLDGRLGGGIRGGRSRIRRRRARDHGARG